MKIVPLLHRLALGFYKTAGVIFLYGVLALILSYPVLLGFYALNTSWCAPIILTASGDKVLALTQQIVTSGESLNTLTLALDQSEIGLVTMFRQEQELRGLRSRLDKEIPKEASEDWAARHALSDLDVEKTKNNTASVALVAQVDALQAGVARDLQAGLITKNDATALLVSVNQVKVGATDGKIEEAVMQDDLTQKNPEHTSRLAILVQREALENQIEQIEDAEKVAAEQVVTNKREIAVVNAAVNRAKATPYYAASQSDRSVFAFVPYDNQKSAKVGAPVFDCYLSMVLCHQVGWVDKVFGDEEQAMNPVLKTPTRGFLVQLNLIDRKSGQSKTLMLGAKPLLF